MSTPASPLQIGLYLRDREQVARFRRFAAQSGRTKSNAARVLIDAGLRLAEREAAAAGSPPMEDAEAARLYIGGRPYRTLLTPKGKAGR